MTRQERFIWSADTLLSNYAHELINDSWAFGGKLNFIKTAPDHNPLHVFTYENKQQFIDDLMSYKNPNKENVENFVEQLGAQEVDMSKEFSVTMIVD